MKKTGQTKWKRTKADEKQGKHENTLKMRKLEEYYVKKRKEEGIPETSTRKVRKMKKKAKKEEGQKQ